MKQVLHVGLVIADDMEYSDWEEVLGAQLEREDFFDRKGHCFSISKGERTLQIHSVLSGIGTVNAAAAAMYLVDHGAGILLNFGLSGGIHGVNRGDDVVGLSYLEYDFDLTGCGYQKCEKPGQTYRYQADDRLVELLLKTGSKKKSGHLASGDRFVSDEQLRNVLKDDFDIHCCDMETSAIAYIAHLAKVPFAALRRVSDDAGEGAVEDYRAMNTASQSSLPEELLLAVRALFDADSFWNAAQSLSAEPQN